ncbi:MAG: type-F conjugative transfer system protein TraW [Sulfuricaulis sp.]
MRFSRTVVVAISLAMNAMNAAPASAEDLGKIGQVYVITEQDFIEYITDRVKAEEASGELERKKAMFVEKIKRFATDPAPVEGLSTTNAERTFYYDPSVTTDYNITDNNGRIVVPAGTTVNPLKLMSLTKVLVFFDGRKRSQRKYVERMYLQKNGKAKLILTGGEPVALMKKWDTRVYFDQRGWLVKRLGITHVPAIVSQQGDVLKIHEVIPN